MSDPLPPLLDLAMSGLTPQRFDQQRVDHLPTITHRCRPDLFTRMAERDRIGTGHPQDEFCQDFDRFLREERDIRDLRQADLFWEARRRARLMYGMPI